MTTVYLVRHGETDWNVEGRLQGIQDTSLNEMGKKQAHACGAFLKTMNWDVLVSSPLKRAMETATTINEYVEKEQIVTINELKEKDFGHASGKTKEEIELAFPDGIVTGMEEDNRFKDRVLGALNSIREEFSNKTVLVVAHGAVIHSILDSISEGQYGHGKSRIDNGGISHLQFIHNKWVINDFNNINHL